MLTSEYDDLITRNKDEYYVYNAQTKVKDVVKIPDELVNSRYKTVKAYIDGKIYMEAVIDEVKFFGYISSEENKFVRFDLPENASYPKIANGCSDIYYQNIVQGNETDENGRQTIEKIELYRISDGKTEKIDDLYIQKYVDYGPCAVDRNYVFYTNSNHEVIYYDLTTDVKYVF